MKKGILSLFIFIVPIISIAQPNFVKDSLDHYVNNVLSKWHVPGIAIAVVHNGKVDVIKGYGVRNIKSNLPVDENTLFQIASNTKAFTGMSLAMLAHQKKIDLNDPVVKYLPYFKLYDDYVTQHVNIRDLLCHRLGFETFQSDLLNWNNSMMTRRQLIDRMSTYKPVYPFRQKYGYCNAAFLTAGEIIPVVTDTTWDNYLKYHFFTPLGMSRTTTQQKAILSDPNACTPYTYFNEQLVELSYANIDAIGPAGSINSCVKDMSSYLLMLLDSGRHNGQEIIPFSVIEETRTPQMLSNRQSNRLTHFTAYGLGWELSDYSGRKVVSHTGGADGFVTSVCLIPEEQLGIVVLTNTDANWMYDGIKKQLVDAYLNLPYKNYSENYLPRYNHSVEEEVELFKNYDVKIEANKNSRFDLKSIVGTYTNQVYGEIVIKAERNKPVIYFTNHPQLTGDLKYIGDNKFFCFYSNVVYGRKEVEFKFTEGKVASVTLSVNDFVDLMPYEFIKIK